MQFAVYLALFAAPLSHFQVEARPPIAVDAGRFDRNIGALGPPGRLEVEPAEFKSGDTRTGDKSRMDDLFSGPPPSPGEEPRLTTDSTGVMAHCDVIQAALEKRGMKFIRKVISLNPEYGVVWRADTAAMGGETPDTRLVCWKQPGHDGVSFISHPLVMFDPSQSVAPLAP